MKRVLCLFFALGGLAVMNSCTTPTESSDSSSQWPASIRPGQLAAAAETVPSSAQKPPGLETNQVSTWSRKDLDFFLHGSMSTEVVPESVLLAFIKTYPDLFPRRQFSQLGLIPDPAFGWPIGLSRKRARHLGGLPSLGLNCAGCHVGEVIPPGGGEPVRVLGMTSLFDAEAYFGSVIVATFRTSEPTNMMKFLACFAEEGASSAIQKQREQTSQAVLADPSGANGLAPGALHDLKPEELEFSPGNAPDCAALAHSMLKLFHNMRASLHVPDQPPDKVPPASGPGRNDAFGLLSGALFGEPQPYAPVKYGLVWNVADRPWVHWDGNTRSPIGRNLLAALGLGAPLIGKHGQLDFALLKQQTDLSETIRPPRYPWQIDRAAAERGRKHYQAQCANCHDGREGDGRLHAVEEMGTEPQRAKAFTQLQADRFNKFLAELEIPGYKPGEIPGLRSTQKYWAATLAGVWARSPYLHNGSVRTMAELLTAPAARANSFHRGSRVFDAENMGYKDEGSYVLDTASPGNSNAGHEYGTGLSGIEKRELIEYLKTL